MTRKDYVALACALRAALPDSASALEVLQWRADCDAVARVCALDNSRFDRDRFMDACGFWRGAEAVA